MRATHSACEHVKKFEQYISARDGREIFANEAVIAEMDHKALLMKGKVMEN